ncbi:hypothetical protein ACLK1Y_13770 [Escherichia coli]
MDDQLKQSALDFHEFPIPGKIQVSPTKPLATQRDLALAYSPGVAAPCLEIKKRPAGGVPEYCRTRQPRWRWYQTVPRCSGWGISARSPVNP